MLAKRDWITLGLIGLAQVGLVVCYWGLQPQYYQPKLNSAYVVKPDESRPAAAPAPKVSDTETIANWQSEQSAEPPLVGDAAAELIPAHFEKPLTPLFPDDKLEPLTPNTPPPIGPLPSPPVPTDIAPTVPAPALPPSEPLPPPDVTLPMITQAQPDKSQAPPPPVTAPLPGPETVPPLPPAGPPGPVVPPSGVVPPGIIDEPQVPSPPPPMSPFVNLQTHPKFGSADGPHFSTARPAETKTGAPIIAVSFTKKNGPPPQAEGPSPWKFQVAVIDGRTVLNAKTEKGATFLIRCDSLNLSRPGGIVEATGKVQIEGKELKGGCDRLVINWSEDRLLLNGDAHVTRWANGEKLEMRGPQLQLHLSNMPPAVPVRKTVEMFRF